ncbi:MAG: response regulator [Deltaproteobacteria bacterium]|nr:response regulator [Deltaproteobacteria bacterium]
MTLLRPHPKLLRPSVTGKLQLAVSGVVLLAIVLQAWLYATRSRREMEQAEQRGLYLLAQSYEDDLRSLERAAAALASVFADRAQVRSAAEASNRPALLQVLSPIYHSLKSDFGIVHLSIHRPDGFVLLRVHEPDRFGDYLNTYRRTVTEVVRTRRAAAGAEMDSDRLSVRGIAPVLNGQELVALVEVGLGYDRAFIEDLKRRNGADYRVWLSYDAAAPTGLWPRGDEPPSPSSRLFHYAATEADLLPIPEADYRRALDREERQVRFVGSGHGEHAVLLAPLRGFQGQTLGVLEVSVSREKALTAMRRTRALVIGLAGLLALLALALLRLATEAVVLRSLRHLTEVAQRRSQGDSAARVQLLSDDELGQLGRSFNRMTDQLQVLIGDLERQVDASRKAELALQQELVERRKAEEKLRRSEATQRAILEALPDTIFRFDAEGRFTDYLPGRMFEPALPPHEFMGHRAVDVLPAKLAEQIARAHEEVLESGQIQVFEYELEVGGACRRFEARLVRTEQKDVLGIVRDLTERQRAEEERGRLEEQLRQSQKMESIGRLAGGVAHDFNNLLMGISGNVELALLELRPADPVHEKILEIRGAAERAANLTRQLLAFSRKQVIEPRPVDLNALVEDSRKLLSRLIGEHIELRTCPSAEPVVIRADPGQVEQMVVNLAVNARDAMPAGGVLTLSASRSVVSERSGPEPVDAPAPGCYALLAVTDTGDGMSEEVKGHLFEPFFTTKPKGKGTGLGLATVYGAVRQNGGFLEVDSEVGRGTTMRIYFPLLAAGSVEVLRTKGAQSEVPGGTETVLLVEDESIVRAMAERMLTRLGYRVLVFSGAQEALAGLDAHPAPIHLMLTDVVMPGMNGRVLADEVARRRPEIKVLFSSGYTEDEVVHRGVVSTDIDFLEKPYSLQQLARKVRAILDPR